MPNRKKPEENPNIPLDIASYKLYYVNYEISLARATIAPSVPKPEASNSPSKPYFFSAAFPDFSCASS
jgi:hypothetical protein